MRSEEVGSISVGCPFGAIRTARHIGCWIFEHDVNPFIGVFFNLNVRKPLRTSSGFCPTTCAPLPAQQGAYRHKNRIVTRHKFVFIRSFFQLTNMNSNSRRCCYCELFMGIDTLGRGRWGNHRPSATGTNQTRVALVSMFVLVNSLFFSNEVICSDCVRVKNKPCNARGNRKTSFNRKKPSLTENRPFEV